MSENCEHCGSSMLGEQCPICDLDMPQFLLGIPIKYADLDIGVSGIELGLQEDIGELVKRADDENE